MQLVLVRHPQPEIAPGVCYGSSDIAASEAAIARVAATLRMAGLPGSLSICASPLARCAALARQLGGPVAFDPRMAEMDFGAWEMQPWDAIARSEIDAWAADLLHYRPGGGENVLAVALRVQQFYDELRYAMPQGALLVCHAGTMRLLAALHAGGSLEQAALRAAAQPHRIGYGEVMMLKA